MVGPDAPKGSTFHDTASEAGASWLNGPGRVPAAIRWMAGVIPATRRHVVAPTIETIAGSVAGPISSIDESVASLEAHLLAEFEPLEIPAQRASDAVIRVVHGVADAARETVEAVDAWVVHSGPEARAARQLRRAADRAAEQGLDPDGEMRRQADNASALVEGATLRARRAAGTN